ncbi:MAG: 4Fe-4S binding protein [Actinobacteria bacterium]|nr:4Fe-4S binding protein [Actinomycetota bacterium]
MNREERRPERLNRFALSEIIPAPKDFIFFDADKCTGCSGCVVICPMDLWKLREGRARLAEDYREKCMECGSCYIACESGAIDFTYPPGGSGVVYKFA